MNDNETFCKRDQISEVIVSITTPKGTESDQNLINNLENANDEYSTPTKKQCKTAGDNSISIGATYTSPLKQFHEDEDSLITPNNSPSEPDKSEISPLNIDQNCRAPKTRVKGACDFCRKRKLRCDRGNPCSHCGKRNIDCIYSLNNKKNKPLSYRMRRNDDPSSIMNSHLYHKHRTDGLIPGINDSIYSNVPRTRMWYYPPYNNPQTMYDRFNENHFIKDFSNFEDLNDVLACAKNFNAYYLSTKTYDMNTIIEGYMVIEYWKYFISGSILNLESLDSDVLHTFLEYIMIILIGAIISRLTRISSRLIPLFERALKILIDRKNDQNPERLVSNLLIASNIYSLRGSTDLAYSKLLIAHSILSSHKSISTKSLSDRTYSSLLSLATKNEDRMKWIEINESLSPFSITSLLHVEIALIISSIKAPYYSDSKFEEYEKAYRRIENVYKLVEQYGTNFFNVIFMSYVKVIILTLKLEILVCQRVLSNCGNVINEIISIAQDLPVPVLQIIHADTYNLRPFSYQFSKNESPFQSKSCAMDELLNIYDSIIAGKSRSHPRDISHVYRDIMPMHFDIPFNPNSNRIFPVPNIPYYSYYPPNNNEHDGRDWENVYSREWN